MLSVAEWMIFAVRSSFFRLFQVMSTLELISGFRLADASSRLDSCDSYLFQGNKAKRSHTSVIK
jgi:hypothetical protein